MASDRADAQRRNQVELDEVKPFAVQGKHSASQWLRRGRQVWSKRLRPIQPAIQPPAGQRCIAAAAVRHITRPWRLAVQVKQLLGRPLPRLFGPLRRVRQVEPGCGYNIVPPPLPSDSPVLAPVCSSEAVLDLQHVVCMQILRHLHVWKTFHLHRT